MLWIELESRFLALEPALRHARLDHQSGYGGEHWSVAASPDSAARSSFESLSEIAGKKLATLFDPDSLPEDLRDAPSDKARWFRFLARDLAFYKPLAPLHFFSEEDNKFVGWAGGGSISNPAAVAAAHCLQLVAITPEEMDTKPAMTNNFFGDNSRANFQSIDQSTNIVKTGDMSVFADVQKIILEHLANDDRQLELLANLERLRNSANTPAYKERFKEFMSAAADIVTVMTPLAPYIPMLVAFLPKG